MCSCDMHQKFQSSHKTTTFICRTHFAELSDAGKKINHDYREISRDNSLWRLYLFSRLERKH